MAVDPSQVVLGAVFGAGAAGLVRFWQYERDLWLVNLNELCSALDGAADLATLYWLVEKKIPDPTNNDEMDKRHEIETQEASLLGYQIKIDEYYAFCKERLHKKDIQQINISLISLTDAMTGGFYGSQTRSADPDRARIARVSSSQIITQLRRSSYNALGIRGSIIFYAQKYFDMYLRP